MAIEKRHSVCIFGASGSHGRKEYYDEAYTLGVLMARRGWECVCGAGRDGVMRAVSDGVLDSGGTAIGVIPQFMVDNGWNYNRLTRTIVTADMHSRKHTMARLTDAVIALPGGCGTLEELLEAITWSQLGLWVKPIVILNTMGYYDNLIKMLDTAIDEHLMKESHRGLWHVAATASEAVEYLESIDFHAEQPENKY